MSHDARKHHNLIRAKAALALYEELQRCPTDDELQRMLRIVSKALHGLHISSDRRPGGSLC